MTHNHCNVAEDKNNNINKNKTVILSSREMEDYDNPSGKLPERPPLPSQYVTNDLYGKTDVPTIHFSMASNNSHEHDGCSDRRSIDGRHGEYRQGVCRGVCCMQMSTATEIILIMRYCFHLKSFKCDTFVISILLYSIHVIRTYYMKVISI